MGILSSKPTSQQQTLNYGMFKKFLQEYVELQPHHDISPPFIISFNQLVAAYYSYITDIKGLKEKFWISHRVYVYMKKYINESEDGVVNVWGFSTGTDTYNNVMISGMRLAKVPL